MSKYHKAKIAVVALLAIGMAATPTLTAAAHAQAAPNSARPDIAQRDKVGKISDSVARVAPVRQVHRLGLNQSTIAGAGKQRFKIGSAPGSGIGVARSDGSNGFSLGLPNASSLRDAQTAPDGTVVYQDKNGKTDVAVQALSDGIRIQTVSADSKSPKSFVYSLALDTRAVLNRDGSADILKSYGRTLVTVGHLSAPWARDANGKSVPTHYSVSRSAITQTIAPDAGASYPVVADPLVESTWWNTTIFFDRFETKMAAAGAGGAGTVASWVPTIYTVVVGRAVQVHAGLFGIYWARGACAKLVIIPAVVVIAPVQYSGEDGGGYCR